MKTLFLSITMVSLIHLGFNIAFSQQQSTKIEIAALRPTVEFTAESLRDPFNSNIVLNVEKKSGQSDVVKEPEVFPPQLNIQGIVWGGRYPVTIINENVFKEGDIIDGCTIIRIQKEGVEVFYKNKNFLLPPPAKTKGK